MENLKAGCVPGIKTAVFCLSRIQNVHGMFVSVCVCVPSVVDVVLPHVPDEVDLLEALWSR